MLNKIKFNHAMRTLTTSMCRLNQIKTASMESNAECEIKFKKLKLNDPELGELLTMKNKKKKLKDQKIIVEGNVLIKEALKARLKADKFVFSDLRKLNDFYKDVTKIVGKKAANSIENLKVPNTDLTFYSVLTTCPGIIGVFEKPNEIPIKENALPITVISDGCKEPNNVGALIRVCNSLPISEMLLPKGNVDIWDTKSIRGSSGSVFYLPTKSQISWEDIDKTIGTDDLILIADNNTRKYSKDRVLNYDMIPNELLTSSRKFCIIIGSEAQGISSDALKFAENRNWRVINIPIDRTANSLNISNALAVILFELRRKLNLVL